MADDTQTLIDVEVRDGILVKKVRHADGRVEYVPLKEKDSFEGTATVPAPWTPPKTSTLDPKPMSRDAHIDRSCRVEAVMLKAFSNINSPGIDTKGNEAIKSLLIDLCHALGGEWVRRSGEIR